MEAVAIIVSIMFWKCYDWRVCALKMRGYRSVFVAFTRSALGIWKGHCDCVTVPCLKCWAALCWLLCKLKQIVQMFLLFIKENSPARQICQNSWSFQWIVFKFLYFYSILPFYFVCFDHCILLFSCWTEELFNLSLFCVHKVIEFTPERSPTCRYLGHCVQQTYFPILVLIMVLPLTLIFERWSEL